MQAGTIKIEGGMLRVACQPHVAIKLQRVFAGSHRVGAGVFVVKATAAAAHELEWFRQRYPLEVDPKSTRDYHNLVAHEERRIATISEVGHEGYVPRQFELAEPAREYQRIAADLALRTRGLLVADDVGLVDWSPKVHEQLIGRANRDGQTEPCTAYYMVAHEGSDPVIADVLGIKDAQATGIVDPDAAGEPILTGVSEDHMKKLAAAVLARAGLPVPAPAPREERPASSVRRPQGELAL